MIGWWGGVFGGDGAKGTGQSVTWQPNIEGRSHTLRAVFPCISTLNASNAGREFLEKVNIFS